MCGRAPALGPDTLLPQGSREVLSDSSKGASQQELTPLLFYEIVITGNHSINKN